jgi:membrane protein implicated in regulation of membrane protease activity
MAVPSKQNLSVKALWSLLWRSVVFLPLAIFKLAWMTVVAAIFFYLAIFMVAFALSQMWWQTGVCIIGFALYMMLWRRYARYSNKGSRLGNNQEGYLV